MTDYVTVTADAPAGRTGAIKLHGRAAFDGMHAAGRLAAETLDMVVPHMVPGMATGEIDDMIRRFITDRGGIPATLGYRGYTHSSCISINHVVCHGIPSDKTLKAGDIVNVDVTPILDGWHGDSSRMYLIGDVPIKARRLVDVTYECLMLGIEQASGPASISAMSAMRSSAMPKSTGTAWCVIFAGTGWGNCSTMRPRWCMSARRVPEAELKPGMIFTIEPMINTGRPDVKLLDDGWTAVTRDRSLSAQFEHSIGITETGCEIFTLSPAGFDRPPY